MPTHGTKKQPVLHSRYFPDPNTESIVSGQQLQTSQAPKNVQASTHTYPLTSKISQPMIPHGITSHKLPMSIEDPSDLPGTRSDGGCIQDIEKSLQECSWGSAESWSDDDEFCPVVESKQTMDVDVRSPQENSSWMTNPSTETTVDQLRVSLQKDRSSFDTALKIQERFKEMVALAAAAIEANALSVQANSHTALDDLDESSSDDDSASSESSHGKQPGEEVCTGPSTLKALTHTSVEEYSGIGHDGPTGLVGQPSTVDSHHREEAVLHWIRQDIVQSRRIQAICANALNLCQIDPNHEDSIFHDYPWPWYAHSPYTLRHKGVQGVKISLREDNRSDLRFVLNSAEF